jgi:hypothetical protein
MISSRTVHGYLVGALVQTLLLVSCTGDGGGSSSVTGSSNTVTPRGRAGSSNGLTTGGQKTNSDAGATANEASTGGSPSLGGTTSPTDGTTGGTGANSAGSSGTITDATGGALALGGTRGTGGSVATGGVSTRGGASNSGPASAGATQTGSGGGGTMQIDLLRSCFQACAFQLNLACVSDACIDDCQNYASSTGISAAVVVEYTNYINCVVNQLESVYVVCSEPSSHFNWSPRPGTVCESALCKWSCDDKSSSDATVRARCGC